MSLQDPSINNLLEPGDNTGQPDTEPISSRKNTPFVTKALSFLVLGILLAGYWLVGQVTLGIPDELALQILTILLYNWFVENGYRLPRWLKKE